MLRELRACCGLLAILVVVTGFLYPMLTLGIGQHLFPSQANGSLIEDQGRIVGSTLIGQNFKAAAYFHPRPSAAGTDGYDAARSSGSNLSPTSPALRKAVAERAALLKAEARTKPVPVDLVTSSASGLDPHLSLAAARFQAARVAEARHLDPASIEALIQRLTTARALGFIGEPVVNVLELNRALDTMAPMP